jgi:tRNA A-37 threonylcarbamoyl transferase component Bud32
MFELRQEAGCDSGGVELERLPISRRELLIRYGRIAPHARDRVLDQFYLLIPDCASLRTYAMVQGFTFISAFIGVGAAMYALNIWVTLYFHLANVDLQMFASGFVLMFEATVILYVIRRRFKYKKRHNEKLLQPTEIGLTPERINIHHRIIHGGTVLKSLRWDELSHVELVEDLAGTTGPVLQMRDHENRSIDLQLDFIQTIEERQMLRDYVLRYVKHMDVRPVITSLLRIGRRDDVPFTKLWCQALQDSRPRVSTAPLTPGTHLQDSRFVITDCIGGGGQGTVYSAEMHELDGTHNIVLKEYVLPDFDHTSEHKAACEQFEKEIRLLGLADHEGVIKLIDAFVEDHRAYLVLHHVNGHSLRKRVEESGALDSATVIELAMQMCDILKHLHSMRPGIMHLDFSPENLLLTSDNKIILIDFNISVEENSMRTRTVMGKQRYMAPEQYRGTPSFRSDIYSLGATLYYLLTAREPEPITVARPGKVSPDIDVELESIVSKCTELEETDRYQSIEDVLNALQKLTVRV